MFYINKYLAISFAAKILNKDNIILIYSYIVTMLLFILVAYHEQCLLFFSSWQSEGAGELQFSHPNLDINNYMLNICINNLNILSLPSDNLYIWFVQFLINTETGYTVPEGNYSLINSGYGGYNVENKDIEVQSTILKVLDLKLKILEECTLKLENNYKLKLVDYYIELVKWLISIKEILQRS